MNYQNVVEVFHSQFDTRSPIDPGLRQQYFNNALARFETDLYSLNISDTGEFLDEISKQEIYLLGRIMYLEYLGRERDRINKINNIVGKDISLTSMGDTKRVVQMQYESVKSDVESLMSKLLPTSYDEDY
ncbi:hypothetical protein [Exiguobacterium sp. s133]|uniref:hypothetical protein n=1 Tax=Exiguobacterium sp. s133 TaxID=2751213 RepID=UPI001BED35B2|nr:hypothetical protein [Exiguobacterium sp. s133]